MRSHPRQMCSTLGGLGGEGAENAAKGGQMTLMEAGWTSALSLSAHPRRLPVSDLGEVYP
jgi:hypothetical protein